MRRRRDERLIDAGVSGAEHAQLSARVEELDACDIERYELDALLDRFVEIAIAHARCEATLARCDRIAMAHVMNEPSFDVRSIHLSNRDTVRERQRAHGDRCRLHARRLDDEMVTIADLVELMAMQAATPEIDADASEIQRRVAQLDDEAAARRHLDESGPGSSRSIWASNA